MTWICDHTELLSIIVLLFQLILIWEQLCLSKKLDKQAASREKGYFIIEETNLPHRKEDHARYKDQFNVLTGIGFYVSGNCDVIIKDSSYCIDGKMYMNGIPNNSYFTLDKRANVLRVDLVLEPIDLKKNYMDIEFRFLLENPSQYSYTEITTTRFTKVEGLPDTWKLTKYNIVFE